MYKHKFRMLRLLEHIYRGRNEYPFLSCFFSASLFFSNTHGLARPPLFGDWPTNRNRYREYRRYSHRTQLSGAKTDG